MRGGARGRNGAAMSRAGLQECHDRWPTGFVRRRHGESRGESRGGGNSSSFVGLWGLERGATGLDESVG